MHNTKESKIVYSLTTLFLFEFLEKCMFLGKLRKLKFYVFN